MEIFGRELSIEQVIGLVECNASPDEDLVHRAALEMSGYKELGRVVDKLTREKMISLHVKENDYD